VFYQRLIDRALTEPEIESATLASGLVLTLVDNNSTGMAIDGFTPQPGDDMQVLTNTVAPDYFKTLRIPLMAGRDFTRTDGPNSQPAAIVNETLARRFWGTPERAIGKRVHVSMRAGDDPGTSSTDRSWREVVGVARDVKYARITEAPRAHVYLPFEQAYRSGMTLHVRGRSRSTSIVERVRAVIAALDPNLPKQGAMLGDVTALSLFIFEIAARVLLTFGLTALALTSLGTYGLVAYAARQRTHEIGIRLAIGADRADIVTRFLWRGLKLGGIGAAAGLAAAVALTRLLASLLYGVSSTDVVAFTAAPAAVFAMVIGASLLPAWRASRTDPVSALRRHSG
jgi:predicted permease